MVRHSTFQVYSDANTKVVGGYHDPSAPSSSAGGDKVIPGNVKGISRVETDKVENVMGSCAGAGSSEFHLYLSSRKRETQRLESIEFDDKRRLEAEQLQQKKDRLKFENDERERKNAEKRKKKKNKLFKKRKLGKLNNNDGKSADEDSGEESGEEKTESTPTETVSAANGQDASFAESEE